MEINPDPLKQATEVLFFGKNDIPNHPKIISDETIVAKVEEQKHLGLIIKSNLSFEKHLSEKIKKAKKHIGIIKHLSRFLSHKRFDQMYKALVRPHFDYCDIIYHIPSKPNQLGLVLNSLRETTENVQYQAALAVIGAWQGSSRFKLYEGLGWESLSDRRWCRRISQVHEIENNMTPAYLNSGADKNICCANFQQRSFCADFFLKCFKCVAIYETSAVFLVTSSNLGSKLGGQNRKIDQNGHFSQFSNSKSGWSFGLKFSPFLEGNN